MATNPRLLSQNQSRPISFAKVDFRKSIEQHPPPSLESVPRESQSPLAKSIPRPSIDISRTETPSTKHVVLENLRGSLSLPSYATKLEISVPLLDTLKESSTIELKTSQSPKTPTNSNLGQSQSPMLSSSKGLSRGVILPDTSSGSPKSSVAPQIRFEYLNDRSYNNVTPDTYHEQRDPDKADKVEWTGNQNRNVYKKPIPSNSTTMNKNMQKTHE